LKPAQRNRKLYCNAAAGDAAWHRESLWRPSPLWLFGIAFASQYTSMDWGLLALIALGYAAYEEHLRTRGGQTPYEEVRISWSDDTLRMWRSSRQGRGLAAPLAELPWRAGTDTVTAGDEELVFRSEGGTLHVPAPRGATARQTVLEALQQPLAAPPTPRWKGTLDTGELQLRARKDDRLFPVRRSPLLAPRWALLIGGIAAFALLIASAGSVSVSLGFFELLGIVGKVGGVLWSIGAVLGEGSKPSTVLDVEVSRGGLALTTRGRRATWTWDEIDQVVGDRTTLVVIADGTRHAYDLRDSDPEDASGLVTDLRDRLARHRSRASDQQARRDAERAFAAMSARRRT